jgi:hypothetical protein
MRRIVTSTSLLVLLTLLAVPVAAQAAPQWYVGKSVVITEPKSVLLNGKLSFHITDEKGTKYVSKCTTTAEGTISNSGPEGAGVEELTSGSATKCVNNKQFCQPGVEEKVLLRAFPWGGHLASGTPARDEIFVGEVAVICIGTEKSSNGWVSPLVKGSALIFDKGHGNLLNNGGITITGKWKIRTTTGETVGAT